MKARLPDGQDQTRGKCGSRDDPLIICLSIPCGTPLVNSYTQAGFGGAFHDRPYTVYLYSGNGRVKRGGQANTIKDQRNTGNVLI